MEQELWKGLIKHLAVAQVPVGYCENIKTYESYTCWSNSVINKGVHPDASLIGLHFKAEILETGSTISIPILVQDEIHRGGQHFSAPTPVCPKKPQLGSMMSQNSAFWRLY